MIGRAAADALTINITYDKEIKKMDSGNISLADIAAVMGKGGDSAGLGGGGMWIFALLILLALLGGGGGLFGARGAGNAVTEADLCSSQSFNDLKRAVADNGAAISGMYTGLQNGLSNLGYETLRNFNAIENAISSCCCELKSAIDSVRFELANYVAGINAQGAANTQKILDAITGNRMADMQQQINALQLQSALCGVIRYPNSTTYTAGANPFFGAGCGSCCG